jgi:hypothetical protein
MRPPSTARQTQMAALLAAIVAAASEPGGTRQPREGKECATGDGQYSPR